MANQTDKLCLTIAILQDRYDDLSDHGQHARAARVAVELRAHRLALLRERWERRKKPTRRGPAATG